MEKTIMFADQMKTIAHKVNEDSDRNIIKEMNRRIKIKASQGRQKIIVLKKYVNDNILSYYTNNGFEVYENVNDRPYWFPPAYVISWGNAKVLSEEEIKMEKVHSKLEVLENDFN